eukprot:SAG11_NODE_10544_length_823_cov_0.805249_3_plen_201_part_01
MKRRRRRLWAERQEEARGACEHRDLVGAERRTTMGPTRRLRRLRRLRPTLRLRRGVDLRVGGRCSIGRRRFRCRRHLLLLRRRLLRRLLLHERRRLLRRRLDRSSVSQKRQKRAWRKNQRQPRRQAPGLPSRALSVCSRERAVPKGAVRGGIRAAAEHRARFAKHPHLASTQPPLSPLCQPHLAPTQPQLPGHMSLRMGLK